MFNSRVKAINEAQSKVVPHLTNSIQQQQLQQHTFRRAHKTKTTTKPRCERLHRDTTNLRKPIPFLRDVKQVEDPGDAVSLFNEYHQLGFKHDYPSYSALIYKLARDRKFEAVETILGRVRDRNIRCQDTLFVALIQHYGKANLVDKAIEVFEKMPAFNCVRTLQSLNQLLNVLIMRGSDADEVFGRCSKMGFRPNSISYNIMSKAWLKKGDPQEARKVFDRSGPHSVFML